nr:MAG TPA: hypothetical protein [Caudoviricetes sp.]
MVYKVVPTGVLRGDSTALDKVVNWYCARDGIEPFVPMVFQICWKWNPFKTIV